VVIGLLRRAAGVVCYRTAAGDLEGSIKRSKWVLVCRVKLLALGATIRPLVWFCCWVGVLLSVERSCWDGSEPGCSMVK
jgi:hypothetical protein